MRPSSDLFRLQIRIYSPSKIFAATKTVFIYFIVELKKKIIEYSRKEPQEINALEGEELIDEIHRFNLLTRSYNLKCKRNDVPETEKSDSKKNSEASAINLEAKAEGKSRKPSTCEERSQSSSESYWNKGEMLSECMIEDIFNKMYSNLEEEPFNGLFG